MSLVRRSSRAWLSRSLAMALPRFSRSSSEIPDRVKRACRVPASPRTRMRPAMATTIFRRRLIGFPSGRQTALPQVGPHLNYRVVESLIRQDKPLYHEAPKQDAALRVFIHAEEDASQRLLCGLIEQRVHHNGVDAVWPPALHHLDLLRQLWFGGRQIIEDKTVNRGTVNHSLSHGADRVVMGVGIDGAAEESVGALTQQRQLVYGDEPSAVRQGIGKCEGAPPQVFQRRNA